ncbi:MAG: Carbohydrate/purine kinase pfkB family protein [Parcubacteria group bacterium GW2011_GWE2_38_18]|nr:MAG: Carbohydrate/purine kinase pfkB family protein [Parcubacteria group bacterium GW2011_GWE2_38_18]
MKYDFITIGGATEDMLIFTDEGILFDNKKDVLRQKLLAFEYGAKIKVNKVFSGFGGGAANAAVAFSRLGLKTACLAAVGADSRGDAIVKNFKKEKISVSLIQKIANETSGYTPIIVNNDGEHITFSIRGANSKLKLSDADLKNLQNTKNIYLTSLSMNWKGILDRVFSLKNVMIAWNPGHIQLNAGKAALSKYLAKTGILILNIDEARELVCSDKSVKNCNPAIFDNAEELLRILKSWGSEIVVITQSEKGATAYNGNDFFHIPAVKNKINLNTVGVGDAFGSTLAAGLYRTGDIKKSLKMAALNASSVVKKYGAQSGLMTKKQIGL